MKNLLLVFLLASCTLYAQQIKGVVIDESSNEPIKKNVNFYIKSIAKGTTTNKLGKFFINSNKYFNKKDTISLSYEGYITKKYPLSRFNNGLVKVLLKKDLEPLEVVNISAERKLKYSLNFEELTPVKNAVHSFGSVLVDGKIYIIGGDKSYIENPAMKELDYQVTSPLEEDKLFKKANPSWEKYDGSIKIYDIKKDKWEYPDLEFRERAYHNLNYFDGKIYIHGGKQRSRNRKLEYLDNKIERFDIKTNRIQTDNSNPHQAINATSFVYDGKLIVMGGSTKVKVSGAKTYTNKTHVYNSDSGYWYELNNIPLAKEVKGILVKNIFYLFGGFKDNVRNSIETLDLSCGKMEKNW